MPGLIQVIGTITIDAGQTYEPFDATNTLISAVTDDFCSDSNQLDYLHEVGIYLVRDKQTEHADVWNGMSVYQRSIAGNPHGFDFWLVGTPHWTHTEGDARLAITYRCEDNRANSVRHYTLQVAGTPQADRLDALERHLRSIAIHLAPDSDDLHPSLRWTNEVLGRE